VKGVPVQGLVKEVFKSKPLLFFEVLLYNTIRISVGGSYGIRFICWVKIQGRENRQNG